LLGLKKRRFGAGRWNGYGGKVMEGESILESLVREFREEAGIEILNPEKVGLMEFTFPNGEVHEVHLFKTDKFRGEVIETEEMKPQWFNVDEIPFAQMWPDDIYWMPLFLEGKKFKGKFLFGEGDRVLEKELEEVNNLE
jgi:8-oxo-dGTP diphosphatase/2-hydroxy-dATP diphosphatase